MMRFVRIGMAMLLSCTAGVYVHRVLGLGPELLGPGLAGLIDLCLLAVVLFLVGLSDREYFGLVSPQDEHRSRRLHGK